MGVTTEEVVLLLLLLNRFSTCCSRKVDESAFETILGAGEKKGGDTRMECYHFISTQKKTSVRGSISREHISE